MSDNRSAVTCYVCGKQFSTAGNFRRHLKAKHLLGDKLDKGKPSLPGEHIKGVGELNFSQPKQYSQNLSQNPYIVCHICNKTFMSPSNFRRHLKNKHTEEKEENDTIPITFCPEKISRIKEFYKWKNSEESDSTARWIKACGTKNQRNGTPIYFYCNRSGKRRVLDAGKRKRAMKSQGSCKIDASCTSAIILKHVAEGIKIKYFKTHYGHDKKMAHIPLSKDDKNMIASQLIQGVSHTEILKKIRQSLDINFERIHLTTKHDIHNIMQSYNLHDTAIRHQNDSQSVDLWVNQVQSSNENCILLYKKQGEDHPSFCLKNEDFLLGLMTNCQGEMLKKFGIGGIICMDATHGTNPYDFKLVSILVVDDFGEGFPVAYLFSNREDYVVLKYFVTAVKESVGTIRAASFMSDDAEQYFAAWSSVMDTVETKKLLCMWHVDRAWRSKVIAIKDKSKQAQVYKILCTLRQEADFTKFNEYLIGFMNVLSKDPDLRIFKDYFEKEYLPRCLVWAACFRVGTGINTNMYLESMHKVLKYIYLKGVACRRLDKTVHVLLQYVKDKQFERIIKLEKSKVTTKISRINKSHINAINSTNMIVSTCENGWIVTSKDIPYLVTENKLNEGHTCKLKCSSCLFCVHMYTCNCMDFVVNYNMCKHIHKICMNMPGQSTFVDENRNEELTYHKSSLKNPNISNIDNKIRENINYLQCFDWRNITDPQIKNKINSFLLSAVKLADIKSDARFTLSPKNIAGPANKKIVAQNRFFSTKKKKTKKTYTPRLAKPNLQEKKDIQAQLENIL
ncbi:uncharacterized protein LOC126738662 isoform X2 [Anthonomus grandis grandis]|uniref:uncharacterized protein LOC126738662 isoform X2 n=1 Tax=Anthonomus grandis grandis TaxID=2921223 RepID=UPI0021666467|nr:uncharacterized protein LOC126738662 isoform X2 [Anthonomus grandis grandis]